MASLGSFIRSAARATFSAYRSVPIRWRLAGGSAALTFVILAGFATIVGTLTGRQVRTQFDDQQSSNVTQLVQRAQPQAALQPDGQSLDCNRTKIHLNDFASVEHAQIRIFDPSDGKLLCTQNDSAGRRRRCSRRSSGIAPLRLSGTFTQDGYRVVVRQLQVKPAGSRRRCCTRCRCPTSTTRSPRSRSSCCSACSVARSRR